MYYLNDGMFGSFNSRPSCFGGEYPETIKVGEVLPCVNLYDELSLGLDFCLLDWAENLVSFLGHILLNLVCKCRRKLNVYLWVTDLNFQSC